MSGQATGVAGERPLGRWTWGVAGLLAAAAFLLYGTFTWRPPEVNQPLKVAIGVWPGSETLVYARESGLLRRDDVQLVEMSWSSATKVAFVNRVVDAAVVSLDEVLRLMESRGDVRVVMVMGFSTGGDALLARPEFQSVAQLKGRRIGVEMNSVGSFILAAALEEANVGMNEVEAVSMNLAEMEAAYEAGELDAVVTGEPWTIRLRDRGAVSLFDSNRMDGQVCRVLVAREEVLRERRADFVRLVSAHFRSRPLLYEGGDGQVMGAIKRRLGLSDAAFTKVLAGMKLPNLEENTRLLGGKPPGLRVLADAVAVRMVKQKLLVTAPRSEGWMTTECLRGQVQ